MARQIRLAFNLQTTGRHDAAWKKLDHPGGFLDVVQKTWSSSAPFDHDGPYYRGQRAAPGRGLATSVAAAAAGKVRDKRLWTEIAALTAGTGSSTEVLGTWEQVTESLLDYWDLGIDTFLIRGFDPLEDAIEHGRELIPRLRAAIATRARSRVA